MAQIPVWEHFYLLTARENDEPPALRPKPPLAVPVIVSGSPLLWG